MGFEGFLKALHILQCQLKSTDQVAIKATITWEEAPLAIMGLPSDPMMGSHLLLLNLVYKAKVFRLWSTAGNQSRPDLAL